MKIHIRRNNIFLGKTVFAIAPEETARAAAYHVTAIRFFLIYPILPV